MGSAETIVERRRRRGRFDPAYGAHEIRVELGECRVTRRLDEMLVATLASAVALCVHDPAAHLGGMVHLLLPAAEEDARRLCAQALDRLAEDIAAFGGAPGRLQVKLYGAATVGRPGVPPGERSAALLLAAVAAAGLELTGQDLGGVLPRGIHFFPATGHVMRRSLRPDATARLTARELRFLDKLRGEATL